MLIAATLRSLPPSTWARARAPLALCRPPRPSGAMFGTIKRIFSGGTQCAAGACSACDPEVLAKCQPPEPGSVTPHAHHVLVRLPAVAGAVEEAQAHGAWWPESVDKEPAIEAVNAAIKQQPDRVGGKVKVTAFDDLEQNGSSPAGAYEMLVFSAGIKLSGVALERVGEAAVAAIAGGEAASGVQQETLGGLTLLVCCHGKRDTRCGVLGTQLAGRLVSLIQEKGLEGQVRVLKTSHVGGHVYAGNVLVYGAGSACDGDWFGGVNADNVQEFLQALLAAKVPGSADPHLRRLWRGRVGLNKDEQKALFERQASGVKDIEDLRSA